MLSNRGYGYLFPMFISSNHDASEVSEHIIPSEQRKYNISVELIARFSKQWPDFQPEQLFYYVYAILHSNQYRSRFAQYLRMDFPRIPFPDDYALFYQLAEQGLELAKIHLLKSPRLFPPLAKYQGSGSNDLVDYIRFEESAGIVQINPDKYFEGITPELWNFHIGGYQVLHKYLKDRKGKILADPSHYCRIVTALALTMDIQARIGQITENVIQ
jgi:predicted helicase